MYSCFQLLLTESHMPHTNVWYRDPHLCSSDGSRVAPNIYAKKSAKLMHSSKLAPAQLNGEDTASAIMEEH